MTPPIIHSYTTHCNDSTHNVKLVDVGSVPRLPGLVLALAYMGRKVTLLESMNNLCVFLEHALPDCQMLRL